MQKAILISVLVFLSVSGTAAADGMMMIYHTDGDIRVQATEQRAVMWLRDGTWEIHIQPVFAREPGSAAWVVPFPERPEVNPGNQAFLDELELMTAAKFIEYCYEPNCCTGYCDGGASSGGDSVSSGSGKVRVWEAGQVGDLEYVIISAKEGETLVEYLNRHGFRIPEGSASLLSDYDTEGTFFFVARLGADVDPEKPLAPVRFVFPGMETPAYPLRLTALGVGEGEMLDLTVWVVIPDGSGWAPGSHDWQPLDGYPRTPEQFDVTLEDFFTGHPADTLAVLYGGTMGEAEMDGYFCDSGIFGSEWDAGAYYPGQGMCLPIYMLGIERPDSWSQEISEIHESQDLIYRYQARLTSGAMAGDLVFEETSPEDLFEGKNIYLHSTGACRSCPETDAGFGLPIDYFLPGEGGCSTAGGLGLGFGLLLLFGLAVRTGLRGCRSTRPNRRWWKGSSRRN